MLLSPRPTMLSLFAAVLAVAAPVRAQDAATTPGQSPPREPGFMTSYTFHLNAASIASDDPRFTWDSDLGGDIDLVDYGPGRLNFLANYKAVLGEELRTFDLNQGSYTLDFRASIRSEDNEVAAVFHHVSRHLSDRPRPFPIDWNMFGIEYWQRHALGRMRLRSAGRVLGTITRSFVDYDWEFGGQVGLEYPLAPRLGFIASGSATAVLVERDVFDRATQTGGRAEAGVEIGGTAGVVQLFVAYERRIDAHPIDSMPETWAVVGFRLLSRR